MPDPVTAVVAGGVGSSVVSSRAQDKATRAQTGAAERGQDILREQAAVAREDLLNLFPQAQQSLTQGFQGALDIFGQTLPAQQQAFQGGNVGAQQQILAGLPLQQAAILGGNVDLSQLQPFQQQLPDPSIFQQQLPQAIAGAPVIGPTGPAIGPTPSGALGFEQNPAFMGIQPGGAFAGAPTSAGFGRALGAGAAAVPGSLSNLIGGTLAPFEERK